MSYFLTQLDQAQKCLPLGLPQAIGADLLMTLLIWQQFTARHRVESKLISGQCAGQTRIMADMLSAIPIPFSPETMFDACQWKQNDAGQAIHKSLSILCQQQPRLDRIFRPERFAPNATWAPLFANTQIWNQIMALLGSIPITPLLPTGAVFQQAMAHLLPQLSLQPGNAAPDTAKLMASLLKPWRNATVYDPAFGSGQLLFAVLAEVEATYSTNLLRLRGQTIDPDQWALATLYLLAKELDWQALVRGDTLTIPLLTGSAASDKTSIIQPAHPTQPAQPGQLLTSDLIVCHLPDTPIEWDYGFARHDIWQRFPASVPQDGRLALIWHMLASLAKDGRMVILLPQSIMRQPDAKPLWRYLIQRQQLAAVIEPPRRQGINRNPALILLIGQQASSARIAFIHPRVPTLFRSGITPPRYDNSAIERAWRDSQQQGLHPYLHRLSAAELAAQHYSLILTDYAPPRPAPQTRQAPSGSAGNSSGSSKSNNSSKRNNGSKSSSKASSTPRVVLRDFGSNPVSPAGVVPGESWLKQAGVNWATTQPLVNPPHFFKRKP